MAFMRRDVNIGLLILIIASILLFSGFSVYYQTTFKNVSLEYQNKLSQLGTVTQDLAVQKERLNETYSLRIKAEEDRKSLDVRYKDLSDENSRLESDKASLQSELGSTKSSLAEKTVELEASKNLLSQTQNTLDSVRSERDALKAQKSSLKNEKEEICTYLASQGLSHEEC